MQIVITFGCVFFLSQVGFSEELKSGVMVESVGMRSTLAKAGIQVDDVLLSWERLEGNLYNKGNFGTVFDWYFFLDEVLPRGGVVITGIRKNTGIEFYLMPGIVDSKLIPVMTQESLIQYKKGLQFIETGYIEHGASIWNSLKQTRRTACWFQIELAEAWAKKGNWNRAVEVFQMAEKLAEEPKEALKITWELGEILIERGELKSAVEKFCQSRMLIHERISSLRLGRLYLESSEAKWRQGRLESAQLDAKSALKIWEWNSPGSLGHAACQESLGIIAWRKGKLNEAEKYLKAAMKIKEKLVPNSLPLSASFTNIGILAKIRGDLKTALVCFKKAKSITKEFDPDSIDYAYILINIGGLYSDLSKYKKADNFYKIALPIVEKFAPESDTLGTLLSNIGIIADAQGNLKQAVDFHRRSVLIKEKLDYSGLSLAGSLINLGYVLNKTGEMNKSALCYQRAVEILEKNNPNGLDLGAAYIGLGLLYSDQGRMEQAEVLLLKGSRIYEKQTPNSLQYAQSLINLGSIAMSNRGIEEAIEIYEKALDIYRYIGSETGLALGLTSIGGAYLRNGNFKKAEKNFQKAIVLFEKHDSISVNFLIALTGMSEVLCEKGNLDEALVNNEKALGIFGKGNIVNFSYISIYNRLANVYYRLGMWNEAEELFNYAAKYFEEYSPYSTQLATILVNLVILAKNRGDRERAEVCFHQAIDIIKCMNVEKILLGKCLANLANLERQSGNLDKAEEYCLEAMKIIDEVMPESLTNVSVLNIFAIIKRKKGEFDKSEVFFRKSLDLIQELAPNSLQHSFILNSMGILKRDQGFIDSASKYYDLAAEIQSKKAPFSLFYATVLNNQGDIALRMSDKLLAYSLLKESFEIIENHMPYREMPLGGEETFVFTESVYRNYILSLVNLGRAKEGFLVLEQLRGRNLSYFLNKRDEIIEKFSNSSRGKFNEICKKYDLLQKMKWTTSLTSSQIQMVNAELRKLRVQSQGYLLGLAKMHFDRNWISYPNIKTTNELAADEISNNLDAGTLFVSYCFTKNSLLIFTFSKKDGYNVTKLSKSSSQIQELVSEFNTILNQGRLGPVSKELFQSKSNRLFQALIYPVRDAIERSERTVFIPDGPLWTLPFAALGEQKDNGFRYLIEWKPSSTIVSVQTYNFLLTRKKSRPRKIVAFGDPIYPLESDKRDYGSSVGGFFDQTMNPRNLGRLPATASEVLGIASIFPKETTVFLREQATEERLKALGISPTILHFASHGGIDQKTPMNSGIALTIPKNFSVDRENGILQVREIYEKLSIDVDLLVLSACQSALGKNVGGEGLLGLTRAFQYAGARSIIASQWKVDDSATALLMKRFYSYMKEG